MEQIEKTIRYNALFHIYGALLSTSQKSVCEMYFEYDLSLSEIAKNLEISRAGVEDALKKGIEKLDDFEEKLFIYKNCLMLKQKETLTKEEERILQSYGI